MRTNHMLAAARNFTDSKGEIRTVYIKVDWDAVAQQLGPKLLRSKRKRAQVLNGAIIAVASVTQKVNGESI